ncbi:MAG: carbohydrate ABC transporter permease [Propionibacteriales bacterium]|nr:carbohydrate ABC transporter permease [Propionibacteriales bacterium]
MTTATAVAAPRVQTSGVHRGPLARIISRASSPLVQLFLALIALMWLVPAVGLAVSSLRPESANASSGWWTVFTNPKQLTLDNYRTLLGNEDITRSFINTVLITVPSTLLVIAVASLAAYAFAWMEFPGRDALFVVIIGLLVVPIQIALIPLAQMFGTLNIFGSIPSVVLFHVSFGLPFAIFLLRNFFSGIPRELLEAARMDGASEWRLFRSVVLPLGLPGIASLGIFQFLWVWNDLLVGLIFTNSDSKPLTVFLSGQTRQFGSSLDVLSTGSFLSLIVPLLVFFAFQRFFVQGVMAGSVK